MSRYMTAQEVVDTLRDAAYEPEAYSGRSMYGKRCVGVNVTTLSEVYEVGLVLGGAAQEVDNIAPTPIRLDNMGTGYVVYWPDQSWPEGE